MKTTPIGSGRGLAICFLLVSVLASRAHLIGDPAHAHSAARYDFSVAPPTTIILAQADLSGSRATATKNHLTNSAAARIADAFAPFAPKVKTRADEKYLFVESDGLPAHNMMVGITAWQQQVPLPQPYLEDNAWRFPLAPVPAAQPQTIKNHFLRGAIALAVNGIPIFNPQNNHGEVSAEIGELDQWGGHCGRADDYHYHAAPLHLQSVVGRTLPISDGTVTDAKWKAKSFFKGPLNSDVQNPKVQHTPIPTNWFAVDFDDGQWGSAVEYTEQRVNPKAPFYEADFKGAKFIWTAYLDLDNTIIFRNRIEKPGWKPRWNTKPDLDVSAAPIR